MKVIAPTPVTDAVLVSSTVPETDYPAWNSATAYAIGARVMIAATHQLYEALTASTNKPPAANPANWLLLGANNRWRMFDNKVGTLTTGLGSVSVVLAPGIVTGVALFGVSATTVQVTMTDTVEGVVFDQTLDMNDYTGITDGYSYFFEDIRRKSAVVVEGLPSYRTAQLTITASAGVSETVAIGSLVVGRLRKYADAVFLGAYAGILDFSRKERDAFGNFQVVERDFASLARWRFDIPNNRIDALKEQLAALRAKPAVYVGSDRFASSFVYGFFRDFGVTIEYPTHSECFIEVEGLV